MPYIKDKDNNNGYESDKDYRPHNGRRNFRKRQDYLKDDNYKYSGTSKPTKDTEVNATISSISLSSLPKSSYAIKADPYDAALPGSEPYPLLARYNKMVGSGYAGNSNLDGGNVQQYANSTQSKFLHACDFSYLEVGLNYRYLPTMYINKSTVNTTDGSKFFSDNGYIAAGGKTPDYIIGSGLIDQQRQAIAEAVSTLQATTFTSMAIYNYSVYTDMPMGTASPTKEVTIGSGDTAITTYAYSNLTDVIYAASTYYQLVLQSVANIYNWHNSFRLKMGTCIRSSWNRETPMLNALFSLFKKAAWISLFDSISLALPGEYIDTNWLQQTNTLSLMPSRKSNSMFDPVMELNVKYNMPSKFVLYVDGATEPVFDSDRDLTVSIPKAGKPSENESISLIQAINELSVALCAFSAMAWARNATVDFASFDKVNATDYFNYCKYRVDAIIAALTNFKRQFNDVREVFDVCSRAGIVTWTKGYKPVMTDNTDAQLFDNKLVDDIYTMFATGVNSIKVNPNTKRWETYSLWNMYYGIPAHDATSGGCFLTFSDKIIDTSTDTDKVFKYVPRLFNPHTSQNASIFFLNRKGLVLGVEPVIASMTTIIGGKAPLLNTLIKLFPLDSMNSSDIRLPEYRLTSLEWGLTDAPARNITNIEAAFLASACDRLFSMSYSSVYGFNINPDLFSVYDIEIEDITNQAIAYARSNGVFRGAVSTSTDLGFATFGSK